MTSQSREMLQDLGSDHQPILLSVPLSRVFRPNERPPFLQFFYPSLSLRSFAPSTKCRWIAQLFKYKYRLSEALKTTFYLGWWQFVEVLTTNQ